MKKKLKKGTTIFSFITKDVWELNSEDARHPVIKFIINEVQMLDLEVKLFFRNHGLTRAADLAFTSIFSLVPILAILFMIFKFLGGKEIVEAKIKPYIYNFLTPVSGKQITAYIDTFLNSATVETIGAIGIVSLLVGVYFILSLIEHTFDIIWHVKRSRNFFEKMKSYWLIMTASPLLLAMSVTLTSYLDSVNIKYDFFENLYTYFTFKVIPFILIMLFFTLLIKSLPNCRVETNHALMGALFGTVLYYITKNLFIDYTKLAVNYNLIYGSIAVLPIFMLWIYWFWVITLFSVEVSFVRQNFIYLSKVERTLELNHNDKIKVTFLITMKMVKDQLDCKKLDNVLRYSDILNIPVNHVLVCFKEMSHSGIVKEIEKTPELYVPVIPLREITIQRILDSVNKMYLPGKAFASEFNDEVLADIFDKLQLFKSSYNDRPIEDFLTRKQSLN
jgi:membrane protein